MIRDAIESLRKFRTQKVEPPSNEEQQLAKVTLDEREKSFEQCFNHFLDRPSGDNWNNLLRSAGEYQNAWIDAR